MRTSDAYEYIEYDAKAERSLRSDALSDLRLSSAPMSLDWTVSENETFASGKPQVVMMARPECAPKIASRGISIINEVLTGFP